MSTVQEREYVVRENRQFKPTELGFLITELLVESFPKILDVAFTAHLEEELDMVEEGKLSWLGVMKEFYEPFKKDLERARSAMKSVKTEEISTDIVCKRCAKMMVIKWGRKGKFLACTGYPECKNTSDFTTDEDGRIIVVERAEEAEQTGESCPSCAKPMVIKSGRYGRFLACSDYPSCKTTKALSTGVACPAEGCDGELLERRSKRGRVFYSCSNYPECSYATWERPKKD
jgi:DNA topoisomerase-1